MGGEGRDPSASPDGLQGSEGTLSAQDRMIVSKTASTVAKPLPRYPFIQRRPRKAATSVGAWTLGSTATTATLGRTPVDGPRIFVPQ